MAVYGIKIGVYLRADQCLDISTVCNVLVVCQEGSEPMVVGAVVAAVALHKREPVPLASTQFPALVNQNPSRGVFFGLLFLPALCLQVGVLNIFFLLPDALSFERAWYLGVVAPLITLHESILYLF